MLETLLIGCIRITDWLIESVIRMVSGVCAFVPAVAEWVAYPIINRLVRLIKYLDQRIAKLQGK